MKKINKKKIILGLFSLLLILSMGTIVKAGQEHNLRGWAWSENIGWISFNNITGGGSTEYGVDLDEFTGEISGYAWSENIGWIDFSPLGPYPSSPDWSACVDFPGSGQICDGVGDYELSGWARAITYGGDNGWIKMQYLTTPYGIVFNSSTEELEGYAWSDTIGWISFNCNHPQGNCGASDYKVYYVNSPPVADMECQVIDCSGPGCLCNGSWETFNGNNVDFRIKNNSTDTDDNLASSIWSIIGWDDSYIECSYPPEDPYCDLGRVPVIPAGSYDIQLVVEDARGLSSTSTRTLNIYQEVTSDFMCSLTGQTGSWIDCTDMEDVNIVKDQTIYFADGPSFSNHSSPSGKAQTGIIRRTWNEKGVTFDSNTTSTSIELTSSSTVVTLEVEDDTGVMGLSGRVASKSYSFGSVPSIPRWREVSPNKQ